MDKNLFAPYEQVFYSSNFSSFIDAKMLRTWSTSTQSFMEELTDIDNNQSKKKIQATINDLENKYEHNSVNTQRQQLFEAFIHTYIQHLNRYKNKKLIWNYFSPLKHTYYALNWDKEMSNKQEIKTIKIKFYKKFYNHEKNSVILLEEKELCTIKI